MPTYPAAAEVIYEQAATTEYEAQLQSIAVSAAAEAPDAQRDAWITTEITVIQWPVIAYTGYSDGFGYRVSSIGSADHQGVDFLPGEDAPIWAIADATVIQAGYNGSLGNSVTLLSTINGQQVETVYGHMKGNLQVSVGQAIPRGTVLGFCGSTGTSSGNHLHFEVHVDGIVIDPYNWIVSNANSGDWSF
jgi:murein DD-endopeptidase MepM/ murein hydrolase activator NlpD